ncbi:hypothetical protein [Delftia sp. HK171]|uniref:hypothetical protein n=1 Tax=Delftia sp. HK171 TaxID=1920191 RepID=UPI001153AB5C|nr:hypothetical protein [Delftia sp. HK171]TQL87407.1 hypothetical protein FB549_0129 [Delftia sp. HK171]
MKNTTPTNAEITPSIRLQARMKAARTKRFRRYAADILLAGHLVIAFMLGGLGAVDEALIVLTALPVSLIAHAWAYRPLAKP